MVADDAVRSDSAICLAYSCEDVSAKTSVASASAQQATTLPVHMAGP
ncbi:MAG: hypothetical protein ACK4MV_09270 [Beijerinckiaceae bacterium]